MNVRKVKILRRRSWVGRLLRLPFRLIPGKTVVPILSGILKGRKWIKGAHNISVLLGTYEKFQTRKFVDLSKGKNVFWDLGAHSGYYSLLYHTANPMGESYCFEPVEQNVNYFQQHMKLNNVLNYHLFPLAVSDKAGLFSFNSSRTSVAGKLSLGGDKMVKVIRLSEWIADQRIPKPDLVKMDIEGEEIKVLKDLTELLKSHRPVLFLSTHGKAVHQACLDLLLGLNYQLTPLDSKDLSACRELLAV